MSSFYRITKHPETKMWEKAAWIDCGRFYAVQFNDGKMFSESLHNLEYKDLTENGLTEEQELEILNATKKAEDNIDVTPPMEAKEAVKFLRGVQ